MVQVGMSNEEGTFYVGSRIFQSFADVCGLPIDQFNFLACMLFGLVFGFYFRDVLSPRRTSATKRHIIELAVGLILTQFCFGYQLWHLVALSTVSYGLMMFGPSQLKHKVVFVFSMGYVCTLHIYRQYYDYGGYTLDVTGPMMIMVQKTTSIAFALYDGESVPEEKLSKDQKSQMLKKCPGPLTYFSYIFCFHGIMVGPTSFYNDYIKFIEGTDYIFVEDSDGKNQEVNNKDRKELSSTKTVMQNGLITLGCGIVMLISPVYVPPSRLTEDDFLNNTTLLYRMCYVLLCITLVRGKYYFAWKLGETVNNAAGFGFNGYDEAGEPKWDLLTNVDIYLLETCTSLKVNIDCWNKLTIVWLRRVVYDRVPKYHTLFVFSISCIWHGFYPGYYICFGTALVLTMAARQIRRQVRPYFLTSPQLKMLYDCITFLFTRFANVYITSSHVLLSFMPAFNLLKSQYFYLHVLSIAALVILNFVKPARTQKSSSEKKTQ